MRTSKKIIGVGFLVLALCFALTGTVQADIAEGLIGYWPLDEGSGTTTADLANANNGELSGNASFVPSQLSGLPGYAINLTGGSGESGDHVKISGGWDAQDIPAVLMPTTGVSVSAWAYATQWTYGSVFNNFYNTNSNYGGYGIYGRSGDAGFRWILDTEAGGILATHTGLSLNTWYHLAGTYNAFTGIARFYIDGEPVVTTTLGTNKLVSYTPVPYNCLIGRYNDDNEDFPFYGMIDDVAVWNRALTSAEVTYLYNGGNGNPASGGAGVINVEPKALDLSEEGATSGTYEISLAYEPNAPGGGDTVIIICEPNGLPSGKMEDINIGNGPGGSIILTFTSDNWDVPQTVTVWAVDDSDIEEDHVVQVKHYLDPNHLPGDPNFAQTSISNVIVSLTDNDVPAITVTESNGYTWVSEAGTTDTYQLSLNLAPTADVLITVDPNNTEITVDGQAATTLTFTTTNWATPQTVTVAAAADADIEGDHYAIISHQATGTSQYATWPDAGGVDIIDVIAFVGDDDGDLPELTDDLVLYLDLDADFVDRSGLSNHGIPVGVAEPNLTAAKIGNGIQLYNNEYIVIDSVAKDITDNNVSVAAWINTNGTDSVDIIVATNKADYLSNVILFETNADGQLRIWDDSGHNAGEVGTLNDGQWHLVAYTVSGSTVKMYIDGNLLNAFTTTSIFSSDDLWTIGQEWDGGAPGTPSDLFEGIIDEPMVWNRALSMADIQEIYNNGTGVAIAEPVGLRLIPAAGGLDMVIEEGSSDTYTVELNNNQLSEIVVVTVDSDDPNIVIAGAPVSLTFTPSDWDVPQTITVTANDDSEYESVDLFAVINNTCSGDSNYDGFSDTINVLVIDNDVPHITVDPITLGIIEGESDTYTISPDIWPVNETGNVIITVDPNGSGNGAELDLNGAGAGAKITLTFNSGNWQTAQTVTVTVVENTVLTDDRTAEITHTADSTVDGDYETVAIDEVTVDIYEDECGHWDFSAMDFNQDCVVDLLDLSTFIDDWLVCTQPHETGCVDLLN